MKAAHKKLTITLVIAVAVIVLTPAVGLTRAETEGHTIKPLILKFYNVKQ